MNIVHIITGLNDGGAEAALYRLCCADKRATHTVISLMGDGKYGPLLTAAGVEVIALNMPQGRVTAGGLFQLWRTLRVQKPDLVQTWLYHADLVGGLVARFAGVGRVFWGVHHSNLSPGTVKRSTILVAKLCARLSRWIPKGIVSCSRAAVNTHIALGYSANRFHVAPNGYDLALFRPQPEAAAALRHMFDLPQDALVLGMVGRFDRQKDHRNLLTALSKLDGQLNPVCLLVGTGMDEHNETLMRWIRELGCADRVRLLGRRTDIPTIMSALDLHLLSSLGEAFPNVLAEAMACGTPCVTTNVGDAALIVGDTGWVVPPQSAAALAAAITEASTAVTDQKKKAELSQAAQRRIGENFSIESMVQNYHQAWGLKQYV
ncbi:MAG: glycosyltransferase [Gammaproteobacteria bacterium]|nr:glycosyltransferase [Gammaproteobacteria bacterium]